MNIRNVSNSSKTTRKKHIIMVKVLDRIILHIYLLVYMLATVNVSGDNINLFLSLSLTHIVLLVPPPTLSLSLSSFHWSLRLGLVTDFFINPVDFRKKIGRSVDLSNWHLATLLPDVAKTFRISHFYALWERFSTFLLVENRVFFSIQLLRVVPGL